MKIRRITIEIEVPWEIPAEVILYCLKNKMLVPNQAQVVKEEESPNTL